MAVRALVVGSFVTDLAFTVPSRPEPGEVIIATEFGEYRGGKGYNQAVALARMGASVTMVGCVGDDDRGAAILAALDAEGVDRTRVLTQRGIPTGIAVPIITPDGDVAFVHHPGTNRRVSPEHTADLPDCDVLCVQGEVPAAASEAAAQRVRNRGGHVVVNPAPVHDITPGLRDLATVLVPNEIEARALLGDVVAPDAGGPELAGALSGAGRTAVVTMGAAGAAWATPDESGIATPPTITAVDATGAGDSFCAALALRLGEGAEMDAAVTFACAAGAHAATVAGAEPGLPTRADVQALLGG